MSNQQVIALFERQNAKSLACSYPSCTEPGQAHTEPILCDRHEIICRIVGMRSRPLWGGQFRYILQDDINQALQELRPDSKPVLQAELNHYLAAYGRAP